ncbi:TetR/AcrR family transcriptional regulator [Nocardioides sp. GY 10127]|uniref:TetR/AcrR family transcriptional regulator n=1 Tax=Nocardioides sp. GY 10127 TaxID=2569762 RepID=UPI0010A8ED02|nr:TetR/AcrR family transcriptional regulator [Nocardioides sp. GY 10127]TIC86471.1 TetR/AcrR family transcriptional regulator [Nocardioides sp. GY 10127]
MTTAAGTPAGTTGTSGTTGTTGTTGARVEDAALTLFAERGFHGTGIRQLAEAAGLSSASLYHWMGTKEELLARLMRQALTRLTDAAVADLAAAPQDDPRTRVAVLVRVHVREHALRRRETRVVDGELAALGEGTRAEVLDLRDTYEQLWAEEIRRGCEDGAFTVARPDVARRAVLEMCSSVARWYRPDGPLDVEELAATYVDLTLRALGADPA